MDKVTYIAKLDLATLKVKNAKSFSEVKEGFKIYNECYMEISSLFGQAFVNLYSDFSNPEYNAKYGEIYPIADELLYYGPFAIEVVNSKFKEEIKAYYGIPAFGIFEINALEYKTNLEKQKPESFDLQGVSQEYQMLLGGLEFSFEGKASSEQALNKMIKTNDLAKEAIALGYKKHGVEFDKLLLNIVNTNRSVSEFYGFDNYNDYANLKYSRFDYKEVDLVKLSENILTKIVPYYNEFLSKYSCILSNGAPKSLDLMTGLGDFTLALGKEEYDYFLKLKNNNALDVLSSSFKMPNMGLQRFIENLGYAPIVTNPVKGFADSWILVHEFGHSFQEYLAFNKQELKLNILASADIMEIASRTFELLIYKNPGSLYDNKDTFKYFHIKAILKSLIDFSLQTLFEHYLYSNESLSIQEIKNEYVRMYRKYTLDNVSSDDYILTFLYSDSLLYTASKYQFSYILAWINAFDVVSLYNKNQEEGLKKIHSLCENLAFYSYHELVEKYDLTDAFSDDAIMGLIAKIECILEG